MKVYEIHTPEGGIYHTAYVGDLNLATVQSRIEVREMAEREYYAIPATSESKEFFSRRD